MSRRRRRRRFSTPSTRGKRRRANNVPFPATALLGHYAFTTNGGTTWSALSDYVYNFTNNGRLYSDCFGLGDETHPGPPYRSGGSFSKFTFNDPFVVSNVGTYYGWLSASIGYRYIGGFAPISRPHDFNTSWTGGNLSTEASTGVSAISSLGNIDSYGATGWNKYRPGNPTADLGVFLGELRDVPRMLSSTAKAFHTMWRGMGGSLSGFTPRAVADAWLTTQFGWKPFISDLRKFYRTWTRLDEMLNRIKARNGQWRSYGGTVAVEGDSTEISRSDTTTGHTPVLGSYFYPTAGVSGSRILRVTWTRKVWFEGRFRYWIPDIDSVTWRPRAIAELFGAMPCPSLIWNLIPWSWLVDWCSNLGDVISNMSTGYADNLAAKYAYVMGTTRRWGVLDSTHKLKSGSITESWSYPLEWKNRVPASPFGFGLSESNFSLRQWSILGALGVSRVPKFP